MSTQQAIHMPVIHSSISTSSAIGMSAHSYIKVPTNHEHIYPSNSDHANYPNMDANPAINVNMSVTYLDHKQTNSPEG